MMLALGCDNAVNRTVNIATGVPMTINQLAQLLMQMVGAERVRPQYRGARQGDVRHSYADIKEAKDALGYEPRISLREGLSNSYQMK